jgi:hypothetical protein
MKNQIKSSKGKIKPGKSSKDEEELKDINSNHNNSLPGEEEIREKAQEIYYQRIDRGESGSAEDDWFAAKEYLRDSRAEI